MQIGEVRAAEDADFQHVRKLCYCHDGWKQDYKKNSITVWSKANEVSDFKMIKVRTFDKFRKFIFCTLYINTILII